MIFQGSATQVTNNTTPAEFTDPMAPGQLYRIAVTVQAWFRVSTTGNGAGIGATGSHPIAPGQDLLISNPDRSITTNAYVSVINNSSATGYATLSLVSQV